MKELAVLSAVVIVIDFVTSSSNNWAYLVEDFRKQSNSRQNSFIAVSCPALEVKLLLRNLTRARVLRLGPRCVLETSSIFLIFGIWKQQLIKVNNFRYASFKMIRALLSSGRPAKIVLATHHQGDLRYGATAGIQCSCMSLRSVCWNNFIPVTTCDGTDLDMILEKGDRLFKSLNQYRLLGVDDLPRTVNIYGH